MQPKFARRIASVLTALGIMLGGLSPAMAVPDAIGGNSSPYLAGMADTAMPMVCMAKAACPSKKPMTCDGADCGCCVAGTCATPAASAQTALSPLLGRAAKAQIGENTPPSGISFPPALPPPIG